MFDARIKRRQEAVDALEAEIGPRAGWQLYGKDHGYPHEVRENFTCDACKSDTDDELLMVHITACIKADFHFCRNCLIKMLIHMVHMGW